MDKTYIISWPEIWENITQLWIVFKPGLIAIGLFSGLKILIIIFNSIREYKENQRMTKYLAEWRETHKDEFPPLSPAWELPEKSIYYPDPIAKNDEAS